MDLGDEWDLRENSPTGMTYIRDVNEPFGTSTELIESNEASPLHDRGDRAVVDGTDDGFVRNGWSGLSSRWRLIAIRMTRFLRRVVALRRRGTVTVGTPFTAAIGTTGGMTVTFSILVATFRDEGEEDVRRAVVTWTSFDRLSSLATGDDGVSSSFDFSRRPRV